MKAFTLAASGDQPALADIVEPVPADDQVLVRVHASSVNPVDGAIVAGMLEGMFEHEFPVVLGRDFAGVVERVGSAASGLAAGDEVFGFVPHAGPAVHDGAWAELIAVTAGGLVARKPEGVDFAAAGAAPLAGMTAMAAVDALELSEGDTVLVVGATGGVGSFAVQLAAQTGAAVIAPGRPDDAAYLRGLGVEDLIDRDSDVAAAARELRPDGVDALLDVVSYTPADLDVYAAALKDGGRASSPNSAAGDGPGRTDVMATANPGNLDRLAELLESGNLEVPIQGSHELERAGEALQALGATHTQGKLAVSVA